MDNGRIVKFTQQIEEPCFVEKPTDLLYLTGLELSKGRLFISKKEAVLYVDGRYFERAKKEAPCHVGEWEEQTKRPEKRIGFDSAFLTYHGFLGLSKAMPDVEWIPMPNPLKKLRMIKDEREIAALKRAADLTWLGYKKVLEHLRVGVTEAELALEFEIYCRKNGASGLSFEPIIAFGENSAYPHYRAGKSQLKRDQIVLVDVGAVVDHYHGDMTRVFHFGKPENRIIELEEIVKRAKEKAIDHIKPGVLVKELDQIVRDEFDRANVKPLYKHSLGHGVGLETHEAPSIRIDGEDQDLMLEAGMVFTIEPGLYDIGVGGIRLEDMILVTKTGHENLFKHE